MKTWTMYERIPEGWDEVEEFSATVEEIVAVARRVGGGRPVLRDGREIVIANGFDRSRIEVRLVPAS